jgi:hypothetical protein
VRPDPAPRARPGEGTNLPNRSACGAPLVVDDRMTRTTLGRGNGKGRLCWQGPPPTPEGKSGRSKDAGHLKTAPRPSIPARRPARRPAIVTGGTQEGAGKHAAKVHRGEEGPTRLPVTGGGSTGPGAAHEGALRIPIGGGDRGSRVHDVPRGLAARRRRPVYRLPGEDLTITGGGFTDCRGRAHRLPGEKLPMFGG